MQEEGWAGASPAGRSETRRNVLASGMAAIGAATAASWSTAGEADAQLTPPDDRYVLRERMPRNVKDFGAKGDGTSDDTAAIQAALDQAGPRGSVFLPAGRYRCRPLRSDTADLSIFGEGDNSVLVADGSAFSLLSITGSGTTVRDLRFDLGSHSGYAVAVNYGTSSAIARIRLLQITVGGNNGSAQGILTRRVRDLLIESSTFDSPNATSGDTNAFAISIQAAAEESSGPIVVRGNIIRGWYRGIDLQGSGLRTRVLLDGNHVEGARDWGVHGYHCPRARIVGNNVRNCGKGIWADSGSDDGGSGSTAGEGNVVAANVVSFCAGTGILVDEFRQGSITGNTVQACGEGIWVSGGSHGAAISGNSVFACSRSGIVLDRRAGVPGVNDYLFYDCSLTGNTVRRNGHHGALVRGHRGGLPITGNTISDNGVAGGTNAGWAGIRIERDGGSSNPQSATISGNVVGNGMSAAVGGPAGNQRHGVSIETGVMDSLVVVGNTFGGHAGGHIVGDEYLPQKHIGFNAT